MAHALVETDTFSASVTVPDDGDASNAASVNNPFQEVTDRSRYLYNRQQLIYPESRTTAGLDYYASVGTAPTRALAETLTTGAGGLAYSSVFDYIVEDLNAGDILLVQGSFQIDISSIVGTPAIAFGVQTTGAVLSGFMQSLDPVVISVVPSRVDFNLTFPITALEAPSFRLQLVLIAGGGGAGEAVDIMSPYNILINRFRK